MATLAGLAMIALSIGLVVSHVRARRPAADPTQFRRRMLTSGLLGLIGLAIVMGQFIVAATQPLLFIVFWLAVLAMAALLGLSGLVDLSATRIAARRQRQGIAAERRQLEEALAKAKKRVREHAHQRNGRKSE